MAKKTGGATIERLNALHVALTEMFLEDIRMSKEDGIPMASADKSVIVTFLKNNDITASPDEDDLDNLREEFQQLTDERKRKKALDLIDAASKAESDFSLPLS